jgi:hypothetical protein
MVMFRMLVVQSLYNKEDYNIARPHSALGNLTPTEFAARSAPGSQRGGALRYTMGSAPRPVAPPSPMGSNVTGTLPSLDEPKGSDQHESCLCYV